MAAEVPTPAAVGDHVARRMLVMHHGDMMINRKDHAA
jgi:hypothetical protein